MVAEEIYNAVPDRNKKIINVREWTGQLEAEIYFIGYWVNCGTCSMEIIDLLSSLHSKKVALFGTCGLNNTDSYYRMLELLGLTWLPEDNRFLGSFFCQGRMPVEIRQKYEICRGRCSEETLSQLIRAYDDARIHPNRKDLLHANIFTSNIVKKCENLSDPG
jgi:hypothetical protein